MTAQPAPGPAPASPAVTLPVVRLPEVVRLPRVGVRPSVGAALWLKYVLLATRRRFVLWAGVGWVAYLMAVAVFAQVAYVTEILPTSEALAALMPLWMLWAFLPVFGGGGELEQARYLDPYPLPRPFLVAGSAMAALLDVQYLLLGPIVFGLAWAAWGPVGVAAAAVFAAGAALTGQVAAWAVTAAGAAAWRVVAGAVVLLGFLGWVSSEAPGWLPPAHLAGFLLAWQYDPPSQIALQALLLCVPLLGFAVAIGPLSAATVRNRGEVPSRQPVLSGTHWGGLVAAHMYSIWRSLTAKVTVVSCIIVPVVMTIAYPSTSVEQVLAVTLLAGGAAVATNTYSYDHTGTLALLGMPVSKAKLVFARLATTLAWIVFLCVPGLFMCMVLGISARGGGAEAVLAALVLALGVTAAGLVPTVRRPVEADHSSLRVRPAPPASTLGYMARAGVVMALVLSAAGSAALLAVALGVVCCYTGWALWRAWRGLCDGAALTAAFKV